VRHRMAWMGVPHAPWLLSCTCNSCSYETRRCSQQAISMLNICNRCGHRCQGEANLPVNITHQNCMSQAGSKHRPVVQQKQGNTVHPA
jgi:hypothetical protein